MACSERVRRNRALSSAPRLTHGHARSASANTTRKHSIRGDSVFLTTYTRHCLPRCLSNPETVTCNAGRVSRWRAYRKTVTCYAEGGPGPPVRYSGVCSLVQKDRSPVVWLFVPEGNCSSSKKKGQRIIFWRQRLKTDNPRGRLSTPSQFQGTPWRFSDNLCA